MNVRKRTCKTVAIVPSGERFAIVLDDKPARIGSVPLKVPTRALAEALLILLNLVLMPADNDPELSTCLR